MSIGTDWKRAILLSLSFALLGLSACGGSSGGAISHLAQRAFVSDDFDGTLHIEDAKHDVESGVTIAVGSQPGVMALSPDKSITLVFSSGTTSLAVVSNAAETVLGRITLPDLSTSYVSMLDNTVGFAAVSNSNVQPCVPRCVEVLNLATTFSVTGTVSVDGATQMPLNATTTLVLSPGEDKLLVFGGPGEHADTLTVIDTATAETTPATAATQIASPAFDKPVSAVFSSDGSKAFILNCGPECGGTTASVTVLDMTTTPPTPGAPIPGVLGATTGLLNGAKLYVAGSPPNTACGGASLHATSCGTLQIIDTGTLTAGAPIIITDGYHDHMELASNNQLFIGARTCTNINVQPPDPNPEVRGCLTIFDTTKSTVAVPCLSVPSVQFCLNQVNLDVTGIAPVNGRSVVYVVQGGELKIYDTATDALTPTQIDVVGKAVDVRYVDQ